MRVVLDSARVQDHRSLGATVQQCGLNNLFCRHACNFRGNLRRIASHGDARFFPIIRAGADEVLINQTLFDQNVQHAVRKSYVSSGLKLQMQIALTSGWSLAWVHYDPATTIIALLPEELVKHWKCLSTI